MLYTEINSIWRLGVNWENLPEVEHVTWKRRMPWGIFDCTMVIERRELRKKYQRNKITFLQLKDRYKPPHWKGSGILSKIKDQH